MIWSHFDDISWWWFVFMPLGILGFWPLVIWIMVTLHRPDVPARDGRDERAG